MKRQHQFVLIASTLGFSWLAMQAVHELGHVVGTIVSGGRVAHVLLHPVQISFTSSSENPHPLFVAWMGPLVGTTLPLAALAVCRWGKLPGWYLVQFFAGFCLIANGAYIGFGSFDQVGDAGDLLRHGAPFWLLWLFGVITILAGLWLWNGLGQHFGLGSSRGRVDPTATCVTLSLLVATILLELVLA